jgi:hypothetical protein
MSAELIAGLVEGIGNMGVNIYNNEDNQNLKSYLAGKTLADQREIQQQMLSLQTQAQKQAYAQSMIDKARKTKYIPYYIAGGVLLVTIGIALFVVFRKKDV